MASPRQGFKPVRDPSIGWVRNLPAQASTNQSIAIGDAVSMVNGVIVPATAGQDPTLTGYGVVLAIYTTANRPLTFNTVKMIASGGVGRVDVCYDPDQVYTVQCTTSVGPSNMGNHIVIDVSASNATTGISGMGTSIPTSASINDPFVIIGLSPFEELAGKGTGAGTNNGIEVRWNRHFLKTATAAL